MSSIFKRKSVRYSIPFLLLVVGGSFGLKQFTENRYKFRRNEMLSREEAAKYGVNKKDPRKVTLETEFEKVKQIDIHNWENKRGPRPWEEQQQQQQQPSS